MNAQPEEPQQAQQQQQQRITIGDVKRECCKKLNELFTRPLMNERLMKMAGGDASRVAKNLTSFLTVITQDDGSGKGNDKKYYAECSITSLSTCFLESMNMQLPFDSRKLVSMIIYATQHGLDAELDISYKGFVNSLNRHFRNAFVECKLVFEEDKFEADIVDRKASYVYKPKDPFATIDKDFKGIKGGYCFFSYTDTDGLPTSRLVFLSKAQILKNRSRAKQTYVWDSDPKAMGEKTCIREGARLPFAAIDLDVDIEEVDNRHYQLEKPERDDRLKLLMQAQEEHVHGVSPVNNSAGSAGEGEQGQQQQGTDATGLGVSAQQGDNHTVIDGNAVSVETQANGSEKSPVQDAAGEAAGRADKADQAQATVAAGGQTVERQEPPVGADHDEAPKQPITDADFEEK